MHTLPEITRRTTLRAAAWSVPVIAVAVATPAAVASQKDPEAVIEWANTTATVGKAKNTVYVNTKVLARTGTPVRNLRLTISLTAATDPQSVHEWPEIPAWGNTEQLYLTFPDVAKGKPVTITFHATADNAAEIRGTVTLTTPDWWN